MDWLRLVMHVSVGMSRKLLSPIVSRVDATIRVRNVLRNMRLWSGVWGWLVCAVVWVGVVGCRAVGERA